MFRPNRRVWKENLARESSVSIDLLVQEDFTHFVQLTQLPSNRVLQVFPVDPMDHTVTGVISSDTWRAFGEEPEVLLSVLSQALLTQLGAKEFLVLPGEKSLPGFTLPEESGFSHLRYSERYNLIKQSAAVLEGYKDLTKAFDQHYHFTFSEPDLMTGHDPIERYQAIHAILEQAPNKMAEYPGQELQVQMSRFKSNFVRPIVMQDRLGRVTGMVRALLMGPKFAYLSNEVINQDLVPFDQFPGSSVEDQKAKRELFLLSYLMNRACAQGLWDQDHLFIIAASGREKIYEQAGYQNYPFCVEGHVVAVNLGSPGPFLLRAQNRIKALPLPRREQEEKSMLDFLATVSLNRSHLFARNAASIVESQEPAPAPQSSDLAPSSSLNGL